MALSSEALATLRLIDRRDIEQRNGRKFVPAFHVGFSSDGLDELWRGGYLTNANYITAKGRVALNAPRCGCESALCDHDGQCPRPIDRRLYMLFVQHTCTQCAANMGATGGQEYVDIYQEETA